MHPFWNWIVNFYPRWLAPNILTFTGFLCLIINFILLSVYDYSFYGYCFNRDDCLVENSLNLTSRHTYFQENLGLFSKVPLSVCTCIPSWLWFVSSICQFLSHHLGNLMFALDFNIRRNILKQNNIFFLYWLDGTDGKQARRTSSSSPLGELFDHGLDSWATLFLPVALFSIFGRSELFGVPTFRMYGLLWLILGSFIISHWEKYNTGILFLPWSYDLSQIVNIIYKQRFYGIQLQINWIIFFLWLWKKGMTILFFLTSIFGQDVWYFRIGDWTSTQLIEISIYGKFLFVCFFVFQLEKKFNILFIMV